MLSKAPSLAYRLAVEDSSALHSAEISGPPVTGEVGELVTLSCKMSGSPQPSVNWILPDGNVVRQGLAVSGELAVDLNGTLSLRKSSLRDAGYYRCIAVNQYGSDSQSFPLIINPPHISSRDTSFPRGPQSASGRSTKIQAPLEVTVHQGGDIHLECQAEGVPTPLLSWVLPDRSSLTSSSNFSSRVTVDTNGTLQIPVTLPSDRGLYRCVASNSAGAASSTVRVHVSSLPPVVQQPREEHLLFSPGRPAYAHCSARGAPPPSLRWRIPDGTQVRPSQFLHGNLFVLPNGTLHILKVGPQDAGSYECTASNTVGTSKRTVKVEIKERAELEKDKEAGIEDVKYKKTPNSSFFNTNRTRVIPSQPTDPPTKIPLVYPSDRSRNLSISPIVTKVECKKLDILLLWDQLALYFSFNLSIYEQVVGHFECQ
uniref:Ig-like domain-containing protein n=1 Tax=Nothobranchius furzeri TaxID=105023 RepID=A0A8C6Q9D2_NOTFU